MLVPGFAEPGKHFERKVEVPPGASVTIQSGPPGLRFDQKANSLVWDVPADAGSGKVLSVVMLIRASADKEEYHVEKISIP